MTDETRSHLISDELLVIGVLSGLLRLGQHARGAAASGNAFLRAQLIPPANERPVEIGHRQLGFTDSRSTIALTLPIEPAEAAASLDDLAEEGPPLVATAAILADELGQAFGVTELGQLSRSGEVRRQYWKRGEWQEPLVTWAAQHDIAVIDDAIG